MCSYPTVALDENFPFYVLLTNAGGDDRCAGFDKVDGDAAKALGLTVARVPAYR